MGLTWWWTFFYYLMQYDALKGWVEWMENAKFVLEIKILIHKNKNVGEVQRAKTVNMWFVSVPHTYPDMGSIRQPSSGYDLDSSVNHPDVGSIRQLIDEFWAYPHPLLSGYGSIRLPGFDLNDNNECVRCEDSGFFFLDGLCTSCCIQRIFDGTNCACLQDLSKLIPFILNKTKKINS